MRAAFPWIGASVSGEETQALKKIVIIVLPLLLLLAGGGAAVYFFVLSPEDQDVLAEAMQFQSTPGRYKVEPFAISVFQGGKVTHHLTFELSVELANENDADDVEVMMPVLKDRIISTLHGLYGIRLVRELGFDNAVVRDHLLKLFREELPRDIEVTGIDLRLSEKKRPAGA